MQNYLSLSLLSSFSFFCEVFSPSALCLLSSFSLLYLSPSPIYIGPVLTLPLLNRSRVRGGGCLRRYMALICVLSQMPCHLCPENTFMCWCSGASVTPGKTCVARGLIILPPSPAHFQSASARRMVVDSRTAEPLSHGLSSPLLGLLLPPGVLLL